MNLNIFNNFYELQEKIHTEISNYLSKKLEVRTARIDIGELYCMPEFQSDCDGDNNHICYKASITLDSDRSKKLFQVFREKNNYNIFDLKLSSDIFGDTYTFYSNYYEIDNTV